MYVPGKMMRHVGCLKDNPTVRVVVVFKQLPEDPLHALVVFPDRLTRSVDRDELFRMVAGHEGQQHEDFYVALEKENNMLTYYHKQGFLNKVHIDNITMLPQIDKPIALRKLIDDMNANRGLPPLPTNNDLKSISPLNPHAADKREEIVGDQGREAIAKNLLFQARMMQAEVDKKCEEAYSLAPHFRPANHTSRDLETKRKAGRPPKNPMANVTAPAIPVVAVSESETPKE